MRSSYFGLAVVLAAPFASGCLTDLGECDPQAAHEIVFEDADWNNIDALTGKAIYVSEENGYPTYAGQAIVASSCAMDGRCHSWPLPGDPNEDKAPSLLRANRAGAPVGLDLNFEIACTERDCDVQDRTGILAEIGRRRANMLEHARLMMRTIENGSMPPGELGNYLLAAKAHRFRRIPFGQSSFDLLGHFVPCTELPPGTCAPGETEFEFPNEYLPPVGSREGREIVRNWLACGAPVVESTQFGAQAGSNCAVDELGHQGTCIYRLAGPVNVDALRVGGVPTNPPAWDRIYDYFLRPQCGVSCHDPSDQVVFDRNLMNLSTEEDAWAALVEDAFGNPARVPVGIASDPDVKREYGPCDEDSGTGVRYPRLVVPGDPDASFLIEKIERHDEGYDLCGDSMPAGRPALRDDVVEFLREWITRGATRTPLTYYGPATTLSCGGGCIGVLDPDVVYFQRVDVPSDATLHHLGRISIASAGASFRLGLYTDAGGQPGTLVAATDERTDGDGLSEVELTGGPVAITAGTYWVAWTCGTGGCNTRITQEVSSPAPTNVVWATSRPFGPLPASFSGTFTNSTGSYYNVFIAVR